MSINPDDLFLVNRAGASYQIQQQELETLEDTDLILVNREEKSYKATGDEFKDSLLPEIELDKPEVLSPENGAGLADTARTPTTDDIIAIESTAGTPLSNNKQIHSVGFTVLSLDGPVFAASFNDQEIYRSTNSGASWGSPIAVTAGKSWNWRSIGYNKHTGNYLVLHLGGRVAKSTDQCRTWTLYENTSNFTGSGGNSKDYVAYVGNKNWVHRKDKIYVFTNDGNGIRSITESRFVDSKLPNVIHPLTTTSGSGVTFLALASNETSQYQLNTDAMSNNAGKFEAYDKPGDKQIIHFTVSSSGYLLVDGRGDCYFSTDGKTWTLHGTVPYEIIGKGSAVYGSHQSAAFGNTFVILVDNKVYASFDQGRSWFTALEVPSDRSYSTVFMKDTTVYLGQNGSYATFEPSVDKLTLAGTTDLNFFELGDEVKDSTTGAIVGSVARDVDEAVPEIYIAPGGQAWTANTGMKVVNSSKELSDSRPVPNEIIFTATPYTDLTNESNPGLATWEVATSSNFSSGLMTDTKTAVKIINNELTPAERTNITLNDNTEYWARVSYANAEETVSVTSDSVHFRTGDSAPEAEKTDEIFATPGTYEWLCPAGVTSVCVLAIGGGGGAPSEDFGGGGAGLGWKNNIPVVPGQSYTVVVGHGGAGDEDGGDSYFIDASTVCGRKGSKNATGGAFTGDGGGNGGTGGNGTWPGGGGAGGYTGDGGNGAIGNSKNDNGSAGDGGGGGGGAGWWTGGGGGTGIYGEGASGAGGISTSDSSPDNGGGGGSGGQQGSCHQITINNGQQSAIGGGTYGGGAGRSANNQRNGAGGVVRILWGDGRAFPSTNVGKDDTPEPIEGGDAVFTSPGVYDWTCPADVTSVCVVCVGAGAAGGDQPNFSGGPGGGLGWKNNIPVTPGQTYTVQVGRGGHDGGRAGGTSLFIDSTTVMGKGGLAPNATENRGGGTFVGDGGGNGGSSGTLNVNAHGGGGAGGYIGNGGAGVSNGDGQPGSGGGGGAGGNGGGGSGNIGGGGGGTGLYGLGDNGIGGLDARGDATAPKQGGGGSGGGDATPINGGFPGGGGGHSSDGSLHGVGADGAVRILWGDGRAFPSTNVGSNGDSLNGQLTQVLYEEQSGSTISNGRIPFTYPANAGNCNLLIIAVWQDCSDNTAISSSTFSRVRSYTTDRPSAAIFTYYKENGFGSEAGSTVNTALTGSTASTFGYNLAIVGYSISGTYKTLRHYANNTGGNANAPTQTQLDNNGVNQYQGLFFASARPTGGTVTTFTKTAGLGTSNLNGSTNIKAKKSNKFIASEGVTDAYNFTMAYSNKGVFQSVWFGVAPLVFYDANQGKTITHKELISLYGHNDASPELGIFELTEQPRIQTSLFVREGDKYRPVYDLSPTVEDINAQIAEARAALNDLQSKENYE